MITIIQMSDQDQEIENHLLATGQWESFKAAKDAQEGRKEATWIYTCNDKSQVDFFMGFSGNEQDADNGYLWYRLIFPYWLTASEKAGVFKEVYDLLTESWTDRSEPVIWQRGVPVFN